MTTARTALPTSPEKHEPNPQAPEHARNRCTKCEGSGTIIEYVLTWSTPRLCLPPQKHTKRVQDEAEGYRLMADLTLVEQESADVISGAKTCSCRLKSPGLSVERDQLEQDQSTYDQPIDQPIHKLTRAELRQRDATTGAANVVVDRKTVAAGDRE